MAVSASISQAYDSFAVRNGGIAAKAFSKVRRNPRIRPIHMVELGKPTRGAAKDISTAFVFLVSDEEGVPQTEDSLPPNVAYF